MSRWPTAMVETKSVDATGPDATAPLRAEFVLEARDVRKRFGHVQALRGASLQVRPGEVLALIGDNGAGKSTLTKIMSGALEPDSGELAFWGEVTAVQSIEHAQSLGVETVYQDLALAPDLSVAENMFLGREWFTPGRVAGWLRSLDRRRMREAAEAALADMGITLQSVASPVRDLSGGQRQAIAVARAVMWAKSAILMDEPTAALGTRQTAIAYESIRSAAAKGLAVVVISHDIPKMLDLADRIAVLRQGRTIASHPAADLDLTDVVSLMLGGGVTHAA